MRGWRVKPRNLEHALMLVAQVAEDQLRRLETDIVASFEDRGEFPDADDLDTLMGEQRAVMAAWLVTMRAELTALEWPR